jgi:hypothetical protein
MTRLRPVVACCVLLALGITLRAAPLAPGLAYVRPETENAAKSLAAGSVIIDLREVTDPTSANTLLATLATPVPARRITLVLLSPETPLLLRQRVATLPRCITIGRVDEALKTDISVATPPDADLASVKTLGSGSAPETLVIANTDKPRFDESTLVREHQSGQIEETPSAETTDAPAKPAVDAVLQRAVQIYEGLVALGKI